MADAEDYESRGLHEEQLDGQECQDCEEAPATHVAQMVIGDMPLGPLYVCEDCYPDPDEGAVYG